MRRLMQLIITASFRAIILADLKVGHGAASEDTGLRASVQLRVMRRDDIPAGLRLCRASHWNQIACDWELFLALSPEGCRVAIDEADAVVGSVATLRYGNAFSWVAMVLVDPAHRDAGIGTRLLQEALTLLDDVATIRLDATPFGHGLYDRAGFREEYALQRMQRTAPAPRVAKGFSPVSNTPDARTKVLGHLEVDFEIRSRSVRLMQDGDLEEVLTLDQEAFGADRRALLDAFWREAPEYAWVIGHRQIEGYLFGRHGHAFEHVGPLVARDETSARRLVSACVSAHPDRPFILDVPLRQSWIVWLPSLGFTVQRPFIRMCRGEGPRERADRVFAITGPEFG